MTEALQEFAEALCADQAMARGLIVAVWQKQAGDAAEAFAVYARQHGYGVTREDAEAVTAAARGREGALSDDELDGVSGGFMTAGSTADLVRAVAFGSSHIA